MGGIIAVIVLIVLIICIRRRKNAVSAQKQAQVGEHPLFTVKRPGHSWSSRDYEMPGAQANRWNDDAYDITSKAPAPLSDHQYSEISSLSHHYQAPHGTTDPHKGHKGTSSIGHVYLEPSAAQMAEYDKAPLGFGLSSGQLTTTSTTTTTTTTTSAPSSPRGGDYEAPSAGQMAEYDRAREANRDYIEPSSLSRRDDDDDDGEDETDL